jgi:uroporphyrinogen decarboxylase
MDKWSRVQAALRRGAVDRVPLSLWRHLHGRDRTPQVLAEATLILAGEYDLDLVKLTPCGLYAVEDWAGGHIECPATIHDPPYLRTPAVTEPAGWRRLPTLEPTAGALGRELEAIRLVATGLRTRTPFMMTIFGPLTLAYKLAGEAVVEHLRQHPAALHAGLEIIGETTVRFARAALEAGADGLFFATQLASHHWLAPAEYAEFGEHYDLVVLEAVAEQSAITVLHLHGRDVFFDLVNRYPVHAVSWHDRETAPSLIEARGRTDRAFVTGLDRELLDSGPLAAIRAQVGEALGQTGGCEEGGREGLGLILAPSCVIPTTAPAAHLWAVRDTIPAQ